MWPPSSPGRSARGTTIAARGYSSASIRLVSWARGTAPTSWSTTRPFLRNSIVGIERIWYRQARTGSSSTFTLAMVTRPAYSWLRASSVGAIARHGPHHGAQKSTTRA